MQQFIPEQGCCLLTQLSPQTEPVSPRVGSSAIISSGSVRFIRNMLVNNGIRVMARVKASWSRVQQCSSATRVEVVPPSHRAQPFPPVFVRKEIARRFVRLRNKLSIK